MGEMLFECIPSEYNHHVILQFKNLIDQIQITQLHYILISLTFYFDFHAITIKFN